MAVKILIPTPLRPSVNQQTELMMDSNGDIRTIFGALVESYPKLKVYLIDDQGELRKFVNIYVNDTDIRDLDGDRTLVSDGDCISIVPAIAGGCT
ncbi:molybdopterin synthase sulfur carrier subunit [Candidatus Marinamargulisbacteria bacterium SCGC AG-333-B06]|nr:molybdopterin synthase sulfur carrier subunit [Candidatus Marinamargulisbacteria bacterium SCGC AG-333-B06]